MNVSISNNKKKKISPLYDNLVHNIFIFYIYTSVLLVILKSIKFIFWYYLICYFLEVIDCLLFNYKLFKNIKL